MTSSGQLGKSPRSVSSEYPSALSLEARGSVMDPGPRADLLCLAPFQPRRARGSRVNPLVSVLPSPPRS